MPSPTSWPQLGDAFVSDGFGVVHRKQASVYDVAQRLPHAMGGLVRAEIEVLRRLTEEPEHPYVVVLGGSKVSDKLAVIDNLLGKADKLLIGGGMVFTFLAAAGPRGRQEPARGGPGRDLQGVPPALRGQRGRDPAADRHRGGPGVQGRRTRPTVVAADAIPDDQIGLDIGPDSGAAFAEAIARSPHRLLERPDGRLRVRRVRRRAPGRSPRR